MFKAWVVGFEFGFLEIGVVFRYLDVGVCLGSGSVWRESLDIRGV